MIDFDAFYCHVTGNQPFRWQAELADRLLAGDLPRTIAVPTGLGKSSVVEIWAYALARGATLPRRLAVVVDRRIIVDEVYERARRLADLLETDPALEEVSASLRRRGGDRPLMAVKMRGGVSWESRWVASPLQPLVVTATVDQVGSRLLFRGYGTSATMRPIDAALLGIDSWLVLDEAHLAEAFASTAEAIVRLQGPERRLGLPSLVVTRMSATLPEDVETAGAFAPPIESLLDDPQRPAAAQEAQRRLTAPKPTLLVDLAWIKGRWSRERAGRLGEAAAILARRLAGAEDGRGDVVGVVFNTVAAARAAHRRLVDLGEEAILLIGRVRERERSRIAKEWLPRLGPGRARERARTLYVVATQTIEVGVNLDLDLLVTEAAPLSSLVQRFGRVDRYGRSRGRTSVVLHAPYHDENEPIYGSATGATWAYLADRAPVVTLSSLAEARRWTAQDTVLDLSPRTALDLLAVAPANTRVEPGHVPLLVGAHVERLAQTRPAPVADVEPALFLHGVDGGAPTVSVVWRLLPPDDTDAAAWKRRVEGYLELVPLRSWELVEVPLHEVRALLGEETMPTGDVDLAAGVPQAVEALPATSGVAIDPDGNLRDLRTGVRLAPGDTVVLHVSVGGYDEWGWTGSRDDAGVEDVADEAPGARIFRLDETALASKDVPTEESAALAAVLEADDEVRRLTAADVLGLAGLPEDGDLARAIGHRTRWRVERVDVEGWALTLLHEGTTRLATDYVTDRDPGGTSMMGRRVPLFEHGEAVAARAEIFARGLLDDPGVVEAVEAAARWHDLGKADRRFQRMLCDGDPLEAEFGPLLAKSGRDPSDPLVREARRLVRVPRGFRHEALSAQLVRRIMEDDGRRVTDPELVEHLVLAHHGHGRPLQVPILDDEIEPLTLEVDGRLLDIRPSHRQVDLEHPARFERLCERYGWWGLAFLESLVRLADMACSEEGT